MPTNNPAILAGLILVSQLGASSGRAPMLDRRRVRNDSRSLARLERERSCHMTDFGTDWPVDRMYSDQRTLIAAYRDIVAQHGADERAESLAGTAERVRRI